MLERRLIGSLAAEALAADYEHPEFPVGKVRSARIAWINPAAPSIDLEGVASAASSRKTYEQWLLDECSYSTEAIKTDQPYDRRMVIADRYGGDGIGRNGGSGRAAVIGLYHVKGIGLTPLVGKSAFEADADGICTLEEAAREAIYSEICRRRSPFSAVPVLAIVALPPLCESSRPNRPTIQLGRALIIRPIFIRPAHFERAYGFLGDCPGEDGVRDSKRTKGILALALRNFDSHQLLESLHDFVCNWYRQLAFCFIHRLQHGQPLTSNMCIDGRLVDFGAMSGVSSWGNISTSLKWTPLRAQLAAIERQIRAFYYYFGAIEKDPSRSSIDEVLRDGQGNFWDELATQFLVSIGIHREDLDRTIKSMGRAQIVRQIASVISHYQSYRMDWTAHGEHDDRHWDLANLWTVAPPRHLEAIRALLDNVVTGKQRRRAAESIGLFASPRLELGRLRIRSDFSIAFPDPKMIIQETFRTQLSRWIERRVLTFPSI